MADGSVSEEQYADNNNKEREFGLLTISLYKDHPELWNPKCYDYSSKFMRRKALKTITEALRQFKPYYTEQLLRRKINVLRTNFNKEYRKREQMRLSGQDYDDYQKLWYYDALMFIKDESYARIATEAADGGLYRIKLTPKPKGPKKRKLSSTKEEDEPEPIKLEQSVTSTETLDESDSSNDSYPVILYDKDPLIVHTKPESYQNMTEHDAVGINVAKKLAKMDANQAIIAENIINNALRRGLQKKLKEDTDICDIGCNRVKYTLDNRILIKKM